MDIPTLYERFLECGQVSTDTRKILPGSIFFALKGDRFNANEFAESALQKGASYAVIDDPRYVSNDRFILVESVLESLQAIARYHRNRLQIPVIGLTGSNGKTTSKELVNAVLSKKYKTYSTKGNLNNHIGVPLTLLSIDSSVEMAVVEMGANHLGEIAFLCSLANPTHGFITNIGKAHVGTFGGFDNIIRAKSELYQHLLQHDGVVIINSQNRILANMAKRFKSPVLYPDKGDYYHCEFMEANPFVKIRDENNEVIQSKLIGAYNFENIAVALCIGKYFGIDGRLSNSAIAEYEPGNMRSQLIRKQSNTIILDAYNANPSSMQAAIENFSTLAGERKVLILGDMFELEAEAETEHRNIGRLLHEHNFGKVILCGQLMRFAKQEFPEAMLFENRELLLEELKNQPITKSTILVKASRGIGLEAVMDFI
jgi:UDP-N-acetylmuramoyl-tripeptide--D-alanyl-D-alanine ligase